MIYHSITLFLKKPHLASISGYWQDDGFGNAIKVCPMLDGVVDYFILEDLH